MKQVFRNIAMAMTAVAVALLMGPGCSHDSALDSADPVNGSATEVGQSLTAEYAGTTFIETYDSRRNAGGWSYNTTHDPIFEESGGNPGGYLHDPSVVTFAPRPMTKFGGESVFTGNFRDRKITSVGIDLRSLDYDVSLSSRYLSLVLMNDNGTPLDTDDDWGAYIIGPQKVPSKYLSMSVDPLENAPGWISYDFDILSQSGGLPDGWVFIRNSSGVWSTTSGAWRRLMEDVSYVQFYYGDPSLYYIISSYDVGLDNPRISWEE